MENETNNNVAQGEENQAKEPMTFKEWNAQRKAARAEKRAEKKAIKAAEPVKSKIIRGLKIVTTVVGGIALTCAAYKAGVETARATGCNDVCDSELDPEPGDDCEGVVPDVTEQEEE